MSNGLGPAENPSPAPQPDRSLLEVQAAFSRATMGMRNVSSSTDREIEILSDKSRGIMFDIQAEGKQIFTNSQREFELNVLGRRSDGDRAAVVYSPTVVSEGLAGTTPTTTYFLPPWQTLHPEILSLLGRPDSESGAGPKKVRVATSQTYQEGEDGLVRSRIGILFKTDEAGRLEQSVLWSTAAFLEVATRLESSFKEISGRTLGNVSVDSEVAKLKLGNRRGSALLNDPFKPLDLETFIDRSPNYLAGLIARAVVERINRESREQDLIKAPDAYIRDIKLRENWDISVKMTIGGEARELVISRRNPEELSFDWADETASIADFTDADIYMPELPSDAASAGHLQEPLDDGGFDLQPHRPGDPAASDSDDILP